MSMFGITQRYHSCGQGTPRENIQGMVGCVSIATGNITDTLKAKGMWENSLFIWSVMLLLTLALNSAEWPSLQNLGIQFLSRAVVDGLTDRYAWCMLMDAGQQTMVAHSSKR